MSIDRIGKGPLAPTPGLSGVSPASSKRAFEVGGATPAGAASAASGAQGVSPADQVRRGELDVKAYIELRVDEATRHLQGRLAPGDIDRVKQALHDQIAQDPAIQEMIKAATGQLPPADEG